MILAVDFRRSLGAAGPIVDDHQATPTGADGTGPLANIADDRTVRLRRRRRTIPESLRSNPQTLRGRASKSMCDLALSEFVSLALFR